MIDKQFINSLRCSCNLRFVILKLISRIYIRSWDFLWNCPQVDATTPHAWFVNLGLGNGWCCLATSHYLNQCCPCSIMPYEPQWVNSTYENRDIWERRIHHTLLFITRQQYFSYNIVRYPPICHKEYPWITQSLQNKLSYIFCSGILCIVKYELWENRFSRYFVQ